MRFPGARRVLRQPQLRAKPTTTSENFRLDVARGHPQRSMMLAAHLFARTPAGGAADEVTFEDALAGALLDADGELHGRWDALTVSQRRAIAALASGEAPIARRPRANTAPARDA